MSVGPPRAAPAGRSRRVPGSSARAGRDRGARRRRPRPRSAVGGRDAARRAWSTSSPSLGVARLHVLTRPGLGRRVRGRRRRRRACTRASRAADDLRAIGAHRRERARARSWSPTATSSPSARRSPGCSGPARRAPASSPPAAPSRARFGFRPRAPRAHRQPPPRRTTPCAARPARSSACSRSRRPTARGVAPRRRAARRARRPRRAPTWRGGARPQGRPLAAACSRCSRDRRASAATPRAAARGRSTLVPLDARGRRRARAPARDRARGRRPRCCSSGSCARASHVSAVAPARAVLGAPAARRRRLARGRGEITELRRGPRAARLGRQGATTASSRPSSSARTRVHRALGGAPRASRPTRSRPSRSRSASLAAAALRDRRALGAGRGRGAAADRVHDRLRRRPARALHAPFSKLGAWLDSIFDRTKEYVVFAGLAIGASRTGDPVWVLAGAALDAADRPPRDRLLVPGRRSTRRSPATPQPPLEQPLDARRRAAPSAAPTAARERGAEARRRARAPTLAQRVCASGAARPTARRRAGSRRSIAFPIGERFAVISITAALFDAARRRSSCCSPGAASRSLYNLAGRVLRSLAHERRRDRRRAGRAASALEVYRDDGPLARALGRALGRARPAAADRAAARRRRRAAARRDRDRRATAPRTALVAGVVAWARAAGGHRRAARPHDRPAALGGAAAAARRRVRGAAVDRRGRRRRRRARRVRAARARSPSATTTSSTPALPRRARRRAGSARSPAAGTGGCCSASCCSSPARCRPASTCWPACSAVAVRGRDASSSGGAFGALGQAPVYDDEEDEAE